MITAAYDANNLILIGARLPQIYKNFTNGSTGQLSIITFAANTLGCVARLFTTMQEGGGSAMLRSYALSKFAKGCLLAVVEARISCTVHAGSIASQYLIQHSLNHGCCAC